MAALQAAFNTVILPIATAFNPDLVIVSAGFDAVEGRCAFIDALIDVRNAHCPTHAH